VPPQNVGAYLVALRDAGLAVTEIGVVEEGEGVRIIGRDGDPLPIGPSSFHHF